MEVDFAGRRLALVGGDLTEMATDAIVNAANSALQHGGGVAGAIVRKGGRVIQDESDRIGHCPLGGAVITSAGRLKARHVIHTVGPVMGDGDEAAKLTLCVRSALALADRHALKSIAFPAISTGIFGVPVSLAAEALLSEAYRYLGEERTGLERVVFCLYSADDHAEFEAALQRIAGGSFGRSPDG